MFNSLKKVVAQNKIATGVTAIVVGTSNAFATAPTDFTTALPTSLIPDGFWTLAALSIGLVVAVAGVGLAIKLIRKAA